MNRARKFLNTPLTVNALFPLFPPSPRLLGCHASIVTTRAIAPAQPSVETWQHRQRTRRHGHLTFRGNATPLYSSWSCARECEYKRTRMRVTCTQSFFSFSLPLLLLSKLILSLSLSPLSLLSLSHFPLSFRLRRYSSPSYGEINRSKTATDFSASETLYAH